MPIKPENKALYPKNWPAIRAEIRARAGERCEWCGLRNHAWVLRVRGDVAGIFGEHTGRMLKRRGSPVVRIVLTVAHLNHNPKDNRRKNLAALCQKCHLTYDAKHHAANAARTRDQKRGQGRMWK